MGKNKCAICGNYFDDSETYEYRGVMACEEHFEQLIKKRDEQRQRVMETTEAAVSSQRTGEFVNNYKKYNMHNVAADGLPIIKVNEPQMLKDYEDGKL